MKNRLLYFLITLFVPLLMTAQVPKKLMIGTSGCSVMTYCDMHFEVSQSKDSSIVYAGECLNTGINYGVICVKLQSPPPDADAAQTLMDKYLEHLKEVFEIVSANGYQKGMSLNDDPATRGISDNWEDTKKNYWKVQSWTNSKFIIVLYVFSMKEIPGQRASSYFNSAKFANAQ